MSFQKFKTNSFCVGQKHYSGTRNKVGEITFNKKNGKEIKLLVGQCSICNRKKSIIVSNNTIQVEGLGDFFKNVYNKRLNISKKMAKMCSKILAELLISQQILLQQQQVEILKAQ